MDLLYEFACDFLEKKPLSAYMRDAGAPSSIAAVKAHVLHRHGHFQVQMFTVPPNYVIPAHTHPNVDSIEVYVGGHIRFSHRGAFVFEGREPADVHDLLPPFNWRILRVKPEDRHGAVIGETGGIFVSIQQWLNGVEPHCVAADYTGPVMDPDHLKLVKSGHPEARKQEELSEEAAL